MAVKSHKHVAGIARDFALFLIDDGYREADIFRHTGITLAGITDDDAKAPLQAIAKVFDNAAALSGNDLIGMEWARTREMRSMGLVGYVGRSSPCLGVFLHSIARFMRVFSDPQEIDITRLDSHGELTWSYRMSRVVDLHLFAEVQTSQLLGALPRIVQTRIHPERVTFVHHRRGNLDKVSQILGCPVAYGQPHNMIVFRQADLHLPIVTADSKLNRILVSHCEMVLAQTPDTCSELHITVERAIAETLSTGQSSQDLIARKMGMSSRTLVRRLKEDDTSFEKVRSNLRRALAQRYLHDKSMSQTEIAFLLGYSDVSSFATAFKRWTGHSPGQERQTFL